MAIINLVATSVPELDKSQVTIVDQKGQLLSDQQNLSSCRSPASNWTTPARWKLLTQRVQNIMQPVVGNGRFKARGGRDVDFNAVESTSEQFNRSAGAAQRATEQTDEQRRLRRRRPGRAGGPVQPAARSVLDPEKAGARWAVRTTSLPASRCATPMTSHLRQQDQPAGDPAVPDRQA